jgi:hypothetical protein
VVKAQRAEIAHRYDRAEHRAGESLGKTTAAKWHRQNMRLSELRVFRRIWAAAGRSVVEINKAIVEGGWAELNGRELGAVLTITFADYRSYGRAKGRHPSTVRPNDVTEAEIKAYLDDLRRPRQNEARRRRYARNKAAEAARRARAADLGCRTSAISEVFPAGTRRTVEQLAAALARNAAFRRRDGKRFLTGDSLSKAIRRELEKPGLSAKIEITNRTGRHGLTEKVYWRRLG